MKCLEISDVILVTGGEARAVYTKPNCLHLTIHNNEIVSFGGIDFTFTGCFISGSSELIMGAVVDEIQYNKMSISVGLEQYYPGGPYTSVTYMIKY